MLVPTCTSDVRAKTESVFAKAGGEEGLGLRLGSQSGN